MKNGIISVHVVQQTGLVVVVEGALAEERSMSLFLKKSAVRTALLFVQLLNLLRRGVGFLLRVISVPLQWLSDPVFRWVLLPMYRRYRIIRQRMAKWPMFAGLQGVGHFMQKYAIYAAIVLMGILVTGNNIFARTIRPDEVGVGAAWTTFAGTSDITDIIVESTISKPTSSSPSLALGGTPTSNTNSSSSSSSFTDYDSSVYTSIGVDTPPNLGSGTPTKPTTEVPERSDVITYTVAGGDTLSTIAHRYGLGTKTLLWANGLSERDFIKPGQELKIPPQDGVLYIVKRGDTLASIAKKYNGSADTILSANFLASAADLTVGSEIIVPGGEPPAPPTPTVTPPKKTPSKSIIGSIVSGGKKPAGIKPNGKLFVWPTPSHRINQYFRGSYHTGLDIDGDYTSPLYAAAGGKVVYASYDSSGYGLHIIIDHGNGYRTLYGHASKIFVKTGQYVTQGQTIAMMGSTGRSTGTHLHFEVRTSAGFLNPLSFF